MSVGKSHGFHRPLEEDELLITADTVVIIDNRVFGKPHSREQALMMLRTLSGHTHEVETAVTLRSTDKEKTFTESTMVSFDEFSEEELEYFVDTYKPYDKAGAYAIQQWIGLAGLASIQGSYHNVMGLPTHRLWKEIKEF